MPTRNPLPMDQHHRIEQFLYAEAAMLDGEQIREWLDTLIDPAVRYQMVIRDERHKRDKAPESQRELMIYDDDFRALTLRTRQFETGLQRMMDPRQSMRRFISNVRATAVDGGEIEVVSYGHAFRFRREYDRDDVIYQRTDRLRPDGTDSWRIVRRRIDLSERVIRTKNLLFFL